MRRAAKSDASKARRQEPASPRRQQRKNSRTGQKIPSRPPPRGKRSPVSTAGTRYILSETRVNRKFEVFSPALKRICPGSHEVPWRGNDCLRPFTGLGKAL